jgi:hypothetical protein
MHPFFNKARQKICTYKIYVSIEALGQGARLKDVRNNDKALKYFMTLDNAPGCNCPRACAISLQNNAKHQNISQSLGIKCQVEGC